MSDVLDAPRSGLSASGRTGVGSFAPALFVGATAGTMFGTIVNDIVPLGEGAVGTYCIVGMGAMVAAINQAPLTMTLMLFEMTWNYRVILPLMLTIAIASVVYRAVAGSSLSIHQLATRGVDLSRNREELVMYELRVGDVQRTHFPSVREDAPLDELVKLFLRQRTDSVYIVTAEGLLHGVVDLHDVNRVLATPDEEHTVAELERLDITPLGADLALADTLHLFFRHDREELPVTNDAGKLVGVLTERDVVGAYNREVLRKDSVLARVESGTGKERQVDFLELPPGQRLAVAEVDDTFANHTLRNLGLPMRYGVTVIAVDVWDAAAGRHVRLAPDADLQLHLGDRIVVLGPNAQVDQLTRPLAERQEVSLETTADHASEAE